MAGFIGTAVRFGGEARDRRLAALRLVGADAATTRRVAAGETLVGGLGGVVVGAVLFALVRGAVASSVPHGMSFHAADLRPSPLLAALVVVLVPVASVLVTRAALRRVVVEPLGVVRLGAQVRRRLWWRLALPAVGLALLLVPLVHVGRGSFDESGQALVLPGMALLLVGVALLLPWVVDVVVARLGAGGLAWDLAVRRLQLESGTSVRAVSAVVVSVAALIAVHGLMGAEGAAPGERGRTVEAVVSDGRPGSDGREWEPALRGTPGVRSVDTEVHTLARPVADGEEIVLTVGSCAALAAGTGVRECADGDVLVVAPPGGGEAPAPGTSYVLGAPGSGASTWTLPATATTVEPTTPETQGGATSLFVTPAALGDAVVVPSELHAAATVRVTLDATVPDAAEHLRTAASAVDPRAYVVVDDPAAADAGLTPIRQGLLVGTVALLLVVGASLLVNVAEQLRERRRPLAVLVAVGARRRTLGLSVLWQVAIPMTLGIGLAVAVGTGLATVLQAGTGAPVRVDWTGIGVTAGGAAAVVLLTTAAILPLLGRVTRPSGLQGE
ncbi:FtsX-like permease family protein [Cellulomonas sp. JZ18]|uniref:ABC transporter permease n=1 Tax=Cellulomonas sp. JZ18 TaxID=2654191 RepID=UPI0012D3DFD0|nr:FtsX-like permease family protein [Cellulomonas sp. JZ18]QGQ18485.1 FtsX-like permease family protein [Cellulomonas sp. JZ18]